MRIWTGKLRLGGRATRSPDGPREDGEEVTARVVTGASGGDDDVTTGVDVLDGNAWAGAPRWRAVPFREFDMQSVFRALAMTQPERLPEKA